MAGETLAGIRIILEELREMRREAAEERKEDRRRADEDRKLADVDRKRIADALEVLIARSKLRDDDLHAAMKTIGREGRRLANEVAGMGVALREQTTLLGEQTKILGEQTRILGNHTKLLRQIAGNTNGKQSRHGGNGNGKK